MISEHRTDTDFLTPNDMSLLKDVIAEVRAEQAPGDSSQELLLAAAAIELYQNGIRDREHLRERLRAL